MKKTYVTIVPVTYFHGRRLAAGDTISLHPDQAKSLEGLGYLAEKVATAAKAAVSSPKADKA